MLACSAQRRFGGWQKRIQRRDSRGVRLEMRRVTIPFFLKIDGGLKDPVVREIVSRFGKSVCAVIVTDNLVKKMFAEDISRGLGEKEVLNKIILVSDNSLSEVERVVKESSEFEGDVVVVGVGGGKALDVAKMVAAKMEKPFVSVPTLMSHDGICSPIAVLKDGAGKSQSLVARMPHGLIADLEVIAASPVRTRRAGVGDLVSNLSALSDWRLACECGKEEMEDFAYLLSNTAALSVVKSESKNVEDKLFLRDVLNGLILGGIAMEIAGTSRPCSGGEHEFSHALDVIGTSALHGEQVAVGTILCSYLRGEDWQLYKRVFDLVGLPVNASGLGISSETAVRALVEAPRTRPDRYTILEHVGIDEKIAREAAEATGVI